MGEYTWYSRLATWAGALVLLVQGVTGRSTGIMTLIGVLLLAGGFAAFLSGLVVDARPVAETPTGESSPVAAGGSTIPYPDSSGTEPLEVQIAQQTVTESADQEDVPAPAVADVPSSLTMDVPMQDIPVQDVPVQTVAVATQEVTAESPLCGATCTRCTRGIVEGQMIAECPRCGSAHHAACWIDNRFHCSTPGCGGHGNLVAPDEAGGAERS